jgi:hypothetical protein
MNCAKTTTQGDRVTDDTARYSALWTHHVLTILTALSR